MAQAKKLRGKFFPGLGVVLHLKEGPNRTHYQLDRTTVKNMKKNMKREENSQHKNYFALAWIWTREFCLHS